MERGTSRATEKPKLGNLGRSPPRSPKIQNSYLLRLKFEGVENLESHVQEVENQRRHTSRATDADSPMSFRSPQDQTSHRATVDWNDYSTLAEDKFYGARLRAPIRRTPFSGAVPEGRSPYDDLLKPPAQTSDRATADKNHSSTLAEDTFYGARLRAPFRRTSFSSAVPEGRSHFYKTLAAQCAAFVLFLF